MDSTHLTKRTVKASRLVLIAVLLLGLIIGTIPRPTARAATPGLPFTEDFSQDTLRDDSLTNANWSTEEQALVLAWRRAQYGAFGAGLAGSDVSADAHWTTSVALGDVDGDGDLDLLAGNYDQANRLYLNNGTSSPFSGVSGSDVSADTHTTISVALGDVDGDGDLDLVAGNYDQANRLYLNDGTASPFSGVSPSDVSSDTHSTWSVALGDVDGDGDLDLVAGNVDQVNRLYLNNGTATPFSGVSGSDISADTHSTYSLALGDVDGDGDLDLVAGNRAQANRLYRRALYHTAQGRAGSLRVDTDTGNIDQATLIPSASLPPNTGVIYWLSNNGGAKWFIVRPGIMFIFPTAGTDLRWRAELHSLSPALTPRIDEIRITNLYYVYLPLVLRSAQ